MYIVIALFYLMLCFPVVVRAFTGLNDKQNSLQMEVSYLGLSVCFDAVLRFDIAKPGVHLIPRYGRKKANRQSTEVKSRIRRLRRFMTVYKSLNKVHETQLYIRLGLGDAADTAAAVGVCRALAALLFVRLFPADSEKWHVEPDFDHPGLLLCFSSIFSASAGDIMFAAVRAALDNGKREGSAWKSIPLKV